MRLWETGFKCWLRAVSPAWAEKTSVQGDLLFYDGIFHIPAVCKRTGSDTGLKKNLFFSGKLCSFNKQLWFLISTNMDNDYNTSAINYIVKCVLDIVSHFFDSDIEHT